MINSRVAVTSASCINCYEVDIGLTITNKFEGNMETEATVKDVRIHASYATPGDDNDIGLIIFNADTFNYMNA